VNAGVRKSAVTGIREGVYLIDISAPPEDGKANKEIERFLSKVWGADVKVVTGFTKKDKIVSKTAREK